MATSEIEKLERRYAENPQGLTFAPLAEVHRKSGDLVRALELLQAGLELHPNYIPASIVMGRCHQDLGDLPAAEAAFAHVLRLDDENVIALKSLADINEKQGRFDDAEGWVRRLIVVDRSNEDAREQLRRLETAKELAPSPAAPSPAEPVSESAPLLFIPGTEPEAVADEPVPAERGAGELIPIDLSALELTDQNADASSRTEIDGPPEPSLLVEAESSLDSVEPEEPVVTQPMPGLISGEFQPPTEASEGIDVETSEDVVLESSGMSEFRVPDAAEEFRSVPRPPSEPEFVVTQTMAEALLQQGHADDALSIYRELARRSGGDARLESRIQEVQAEVARSAAGRPSYVAHDSNGQSVAAFFRAMLAARLPADPAAAGSSQGPLAGEGGAPTRPAPDAVSLSSVFGEESLPVPPAVPAADRRTESGVSFDAFFSSTSEGSSSAKSRSSNPGNDDLDQFHSWLQNLKR